MSEQKLGFRKNGAGQQLGVIVPQPVNNDDEALRQGREASESLNPEGFANYDGWNRRAPKDRGTK